MISSSTCNEGGLFDSAGLRRVRQYRTNERPRQGRRCIGRGRMIAARPSGRERSPAPPSERPSGTMTDTDAGAPENAQQAEGPGIRILAQFIRDLSFENPRAPETLRGGAAQPQIELGVEMNARGREDGFFEVDLKLSAKASRDDGPVFVVELLYGGVFQIAGVGADDMEPVLLVECPGYLSRFARR